MAKREISHLDIKIRLMKEYLENGGLEKIPDAGILEDLMKVKSLPNGKANPETVTVRLNALMMAILGSHMIPPFFHPDFISEYQSTLQKSNSFHQINIDTQEQFNEIYEELKDKNDFLFRGQGEAKWRLYSQLQRVWINNKLFKTEDSFQKFLEKLVENGLETYGDNIRKILAGNNIATANAVSVLGYLQHHGCPTPLLDWTYRFQNAIYFALDGVAPNPGTREIEDYFSVYFIEEKYFKGSNMRDIIDSGLSHFEGPELSRLIAQIAKDEPTRLAMEKHFAGRKLFDRKKASEMGLVNHMTKVESLMGFPIAYFSDKDIEADIMFSLINSENIINQAGVFTWNHDPSKPIELVGDEQYKEGNPKDKKSDYKFCSCYNINKNLVPFIQQCIEKDGVTKEYIYPTPDINTWEIFEKCKAL